MQDLVLIYSAYKGTDAKYILFVTKNGIVKKTPIEEYLGTKKKGGIIATKLREDDNLAAISLIKDEDIMLFTQNGMGIRFKSFEIVSTSRATIGVKGINLAENDSVISVVIIRDNKDDVAVFGQKGLGLRINLSETTTQSRGGKGIQFYKDKVAGVTLVNDSDNILIGGNKSSVCMSAKDMPRLSRGALGNILIKDNVIQKISKI